MIRFRPLLLMTLFSIAAFAALVWLGRWQWERYEQKLAAAGARAPEITIVDYQPLLGGLQFVHGVRPDTHEQGWRVFAPVQEGERVVFIDADFVTGVEGPNAEEVRFPAALRDGAPIKGVSLEPRPPGPFAPAPQPLRRLWFATDLAAMGRNGGLENVAKTYVAVGYIGPDGRAVANPFAHGGDQLPPARHLGYAITWYGLAAVLLAIYFAYHASVGRLSFAAPRSRED